MYLEHFGLKEFPFSITPDTAFFFSSDASQGALNTLLVATRAGEGFIKIIGEVGTGKTLLCRQLLRSVGPDFQTAYVPNPYQTPMGLLSDLVEELGANTTEMGTAPPAQQWHLLLKTLNQRLLALAHENKRVLVCLDEAQAMPIETLEALRLLTNLESEKRKLVQVVIFGQPELDQRLNHPSIRQLKQRITFDYYLGPLSNGELQRYVNHRMAVAGYNGPPVFTRLALWMLRSRSRGFPRLVNIAAHKALMSAYGRGKRRVGLLEVNEAVEDTASLRKRSHLVVLAGVALCSLGLIIFQFTKGL